MNTQTDRTAARLARIHRWGRELAEQGKHPMGSYRLGSPEDRAARAGYAERHCELLSANKPH